MVTILIKTLRYLTLFFTHLNYLHFMIDPIVKIFTKVLFRLIKVWILNGGSIIVKIVNWLMECHVLRLLMYWQSATLLVIGLIVNVIGWLLFVIKA